MIDFSRWVFGTNSLTRSPEAARQGTIAYRPADCDGLTRVLCIQTLARNRLTGVAIASSDVQVVCQRMNSSGALPASKDTDTAVRPGRRTTWCA